MNTEFLKGDFIKYIAVERAFPDFQPCPCLLSALERFVIFPKSLSPEGFRVYCIIKSLKNNNNKRPESVALLLTSNTMLFVVFVLKHIKTYRAHARIFLAQ